MKVEKYINVKGEVWVRIKFTDRSRTEVIISEDEFEKYYGNVE